MENTITSNAMSASLLSRDVYGVCFPQRDSLDVLHSEFAAAREQFFSGGRKTVKVGRSQVVKGFDGKLKGKLSRRGLYWKKTATGMAGERAIALEEVFEQKGGWMLVTRDFRNVIVSRAFFNKSHIWLKSEYYEPWDAACARVIFKPGDLGDTVERFDWDPVNKRYDSTLLYPVTYQPGTPEESLLTARFGQPQLLVATAQGQFGYCPQQEAKDRQQAREQIQEGTILLMPAWEVKDGEIAKAQKEEDEESSISFTTLEDYAQLPPAQEEASQEEANSPAGEEMPEKETPSPAGEEMPEKEAPSPAGEEAPEKEAPSVGEEAPEKEAPSPAGEEAPEKEAPSPAGEEAPEKEASPAGEEVPEKEAQSPTGEEMPEEEAPSPAEEETPGEEPLPQEDAAILQAARQAAQGQPQPGEVQPGEGTLVVQGKEAGRAAAYDGAYAQGKRQGFGSAYYQDGALRYAGFWNQGKKEGLGVSFRDGDHALHVARWTDGKPGEFVSLFDGQGNLRYSGYMKDGKKDGAGVSPAPQGEGLYVGKWKDGESLEVGSAFDREGNLLYYGQWKDGKRHGRGTAFDKTGAVVFDGEWKEDAYFNGVLYQKWGGEDPAGEPEGTDPDWDL